MTAHPLLLRALPRRSGRVPALPYPPGRQREHSTGPRPGQCADSGPVALIRKEGKLEVEKCYPCPDTEVLPMS
jgi:hypothetical protein